MSPVAALEEGFGLPGFVDPATARVFSKEVEMAEAKTAVAHKPVWLDLSSSDAAASRDFYSKLFEWKVEVNPDPQYGGYALAKVGGKDVAGIGPKMSPEAPNAWLVYIGSADAADTAKKAKAAGGNVLAEPMAVGPQGTMAVIQDPSGAVIGVWQPGVMTGSPVIGQANAFGWAELNARGIERAKPFYNKLFGWGEKNTEMGEGQAPYTEFMLGSDSIAGGMEMNPMVPAEVPSYWLAYFTVPDVDKAHEKATKLGATALLEPQDFPGGRFSILNDPQGAAFGLLVMKS
jgi:predicted enzyme related to lactoylglutathione lyase